MFKDLFSFFLYFGRHSLQGGIAVVARRCATRVAAEVGNMSECCFVRLHTVVVWFPTIAFAGVFLGRTF